ncbi:MAG: hypothetical protein AB1758_08960 [Candidatus Eremiobacterota bacterium]
MPEREQAERWLGRPISPENWARASLAADRVLLRAGARRPSEVAWDEGLQIVVSCSDHRVGPLRFRARLEGRRITVYRSGLEELAVSHPLDLALAHELFHWFEPAFPQPELGAHLLATRWLRLPRFAGLLEPRTARELARCDARGTGGTR